MREASYGYPPENPDDIVWVTAEEFIAREKADPEQWTVKPHCPHCKTPLRIWNSKGTQGFKLVSMEVTRKPEQIRDLGEPVIGFQHLPHTAKNDCPYSFKNDPHYAYWKYKGRKTAQREKQKNIEKFKERDVIEEQKVILHRFIKPLTGHKKISEEHKKIIDRLTRSKIIHMPGLAEHTWLIPYLQVILFGAHLREDNSPDRKMPARLRAWRPGPSAKLSYTTVNDEIRQIEVPSYMELCFVHPKNIGIRYVPMRPDGHTPIVFQISQEWAMGYVKQRLKKREKIADARRREVKKLTRKLHGQRQLAFF